MMDDLLQRLHGLAAARAPVQLHASDLQVFAGVETHTSPRYQWDGTKRGADPAHPAALFQYTLDGWGNYTAGGTSHRLQAGVAFTAIIPSEHVYSLPAASSGWTFFWVMLWHPYIVERLARRQHELGPIQHAEPRSPLVLRALDLFEHACTPGPRDALASEQALFAFLWEHERAMLQGGAAQNQNERLRDMVRRTVLGALERPIDVADLAAAHGMSRSHFSHTFKAATGLGPAQFIQQIRLEEATRRLLQTNQTVTIIATDTGFANPNHFCKVFRQRFHLSPGAFRKQMRQ